MVFVFAFVNRREKVKINCQHKLRRIIVKMGLRSGLILPFQFRDTKKLLMIGGPDEERELDVFDLKNVVRAAFGIYNFEFRNKKIGFNIPDDLFLQYISQRHDLTNFVIEILQAQDEINAKEPLLSFEPSCSTQQQTGTPASHKHNDIGNETTTHSTSSAAGYSPNAGSQSHAPDHHHPQQQQQHQQQREKTPHLNNSEHSNEQDEPPHKLRITHPYHVHTPESLTQSIDPMDIMPKWEQQEEASAAATAAPAGGAGPEVETKRVRYFAREQAMQHALQHHQQMQQQQQQQQQLQQHQQQQHYFTSYNPALLPNTSGSGATMQLLGQHHTQTAGGHQQQNSGLPPPPPPPTATPANDHPHPPQTPYTPGMMNRFRRRGERMSKDQKELYVKYFEENPCMLTQRRNDIMLEPHWYKLCSLLNTVPQGAVKNVEEWKQTFDAWRYRVFMYTRYNYKLSGAAAQNPKNYKPLTTTDQRAYAMWTSYKSSVHEFDKMEMFGNLDDTQSAE